MRVIISGIRCCARCSDRKRFGESCCASCGKVGDGLFSADGIHGDSGVDEELEAQRISRGLRPSKYVDGSIDRKFIRFRLRLLPTAGVVSTADLAVTTDASVSFAAQEVNCCCCDFLSENRLLGGFQCQILGSLLTGAESVKSVLYENYWYSNSL